MGNEDMTGPPVGDRWPVDDLARSVQDYVPPTAEECARAVEEAFRRLDAMTPAEIEALAIDGEFAQIAARFHSCEDADDAGGVLG